MQSSVIWGLLASVLSFGLIGRLFEGVSALHVVRVCQNKHCCKRANADILQTIHNLSGEKDFRVEASGCLSHCDKGPNVEVTATSGEVSLLHGMSNAQTCISQLGTTTESISKIMIAATKVMEQSQQFAANGQLEEAIRYLTSVIDKLDSSPATSPRTPANAHAHALRAQAHLELARTPNDRENGASRKNELVLAIRDAQRVVQDFSNVATPRSISLAYRTWADALLEEQNLDQVQEVQNDFSKVLAVLKTWQRDQPMYRTKLQREIQDLRLAMQ